MVTMAIVSFTNYKRKQTRGMMSAVMRYTMQEKKTAWEDKRLATGVNCSAETVYGDFMTTKRLHHKEGGTLFYHMVQSFPADETVDPVTAHAAALELANYFPDCEVLVCTHIDRDHIHSHFIINSVQLENGKKLHIAKEQLQELRQRNDEVCAQFGLPVFQKQQTKKVKSVSNAEYHTALKGESWKLRLANTIDDCMRYAGSREEFISLMESEGYSVRWEQNRKYITYTTPEGMRCRDSKLHEEKYLKEVMEHEFRMRAKFSDRDSESPDGIDLTYRTGWEQERAAYLQMAGMASGLRPLARGQMGHAGAGPDSSVAGNGVRRGDGDQQHPKSLPLIPLYGLAALGALMEDDNEEAEEKYRRMMAEKEAKNIGAVLGLAAGTAIALTKKPEEEVQQQQQTMGGL